MNSKQITVSDRAAAQIAAIIADEGGNTMLRQAREAEDLAIDKGGVTVLIDPVSQIYMEGSEIDFADELIGAAFKVNNPNATASCGCGTSFSI